MVSRRQLIKISALGTASFAAPAAYSVSEISMSYNTLNPIGSTDPRDLSDNAKSFDSFANGPASTYKDRFGVDRKSIPGMVADFDSDQVQRKREFQSTQDDRESTFTAFQSESESAFDAAQAGRVSRFDHFLQSSGYELLGDYADSPLQITAHNQYLMKDGQPYRLSSFVAVPYTTTGNWVAESDAFVLLGDDVLRQELADPINGAGEVGLDGRTVADFLRDSIVVLTGKSDSTAQLNAALVQGAADGRVVFTPGRGKVLNLLGTVVVPSGATYICDAKVQGGAQTDIFSVAGSTNARLELRSDLIGNATNVKQNGVLAAGANFCDIRVLGEIRDIKNKGVSLAGQAAAGTTCQHNRVYVRKVTGCDSSSGAGVSLSGERCTNNIVTVDDASLNRIGITLNGAHDNHLYPGSLSCNTDAGLMIDGFVSSSGDGGKRNRVHGGVYDRNGPSIAYGGIYLGNGSSSNTFFAPSCRGNSGAGIRQSSGVGYESTDNAYYNPICEGNAASGFVLTFSPDTTLFNPKIHGNTGRGITHSCSPNFKVFGGHSRSNTTVGYFSQSPDSQLHGIELSGNSIGCQISSDGSTTYSGHLFVGCLVKGNATDYAIDPGAARIIAGLGAGNPSVYVGDANIVGVPGKTFIVNAVITATRTIATPPAALASAAGDRIRVVRPASASGVPNVFLGSLKGIAAGQWMEAEFDGATWMLIGFGSL